jgi:2-dehydro-3-deoxyphosphogluconate aldolase/(4S)-4-hydroxy-2-oxoglutarate aldolase
MTLSPSDASRQLRQICGLTPILPVLLIEDAAHSVPLAQALIRGGLPVLEVTLRTPCALEAIGEMAQVQGGYVGAGTLLTRRDVKAAKDAGASFGVSPGATDDLIAACADHDLPLLPGAATASEAMALAARGFDMLKFFPAEFIGGAKALAALNAPLPHIAFCPTGGINMTNAPSYLRLDNVICAGGSWIAPRDLVAAGDWAQIEGLAQGAAALGKHNDS